VGLNDEKTEGQKSRATVPVKTPFSTSASRITLILGVYGDVKDMPAKHAYFKF
jgi:hypothetical protein